MSKKFLKESKPNSLDHNFYGILVFNFAMSARVLVCILLQMDCQHLGCHGMASSHSLVASCHHKQQQQPT